MRIKSNMFCQVNGSFIMKSLRYDSETMNVVYLYSPNYSIKSAKSFAVKDNIFCIHTMGDKRILHTDNLVHPVKTVFITADKDAFDYPCFIQLLGCINAVDEKLIG